jgi:DNA excision repair protein ERCC-4
MVICDTGSVRQTRAAVVQPSSIANLELEVCPFVCAVDTREQSPWTFQGIVIERRQLIVKQDRRTLQTGDYSIVGHEGSLAIERKSATDLLGSITAGNARFRREHERMNSIVESGGFACVIVEGDLSRICDELDDPNGGRQISSNTVLGVVATWPRRYRVPWFFAGDRRRAELLGFRILWKWYHEQQIKAA